MMPFKVSYFGLRCIGFRFVSHHTDPKPHMLACVHPHQEVGLEIAASSDGQWIMWLRSDVAYSKCRFCYIKTVTTMQEIVQLMEAISGQRVEVESRDEAEFEIALQEETADCERRHKEYLTNDRWGRIPGGL